MKRTCSNLLIAMLVLASSATFAHATSIANDDPERCGERGATTVHRTVGAATAPMAPTRIVTPPTSAALMASRKPVTPPVVARKVNAPKPARVAPHANAPAPATPGMGILSKMANGATGGEATWSPSKPADNSTGASWIL